MRDTIGPCGADLSIRSPGDMVVGELIVVGGTQFELLSQPFLGMTGSSIFDTQELFWRARVRPMDGAERTAGYVTWALDETVNILAPRFPSRSERPGWAARRAIHGTDLARRDSGRTARRSRSSPVTDRGA